MLFPLSLLLSPSFLSSFLPSYSLPFPLPSLISILPPFSFPILYSLPSFPPLLSPSPPVPSQHERDTQLKQRVAEAVEKVKRQAAEEKQRLVVEANTKLRDSVSAARSEIESRVAQTQALAVQEALKEANAQSSSKEVYKHVLITGVLSIAWQFDTVCL